MKINKIKDITGNRYGKLTAVRFVGQNKHWDALWEFKCDCGNTIVRPAFSVKSGNVRSCGCLRFNDLTGKKYGNLTVLEFVGQDADKNNLWKCKCRCGNICVVPAHRLISGHTRSCGCLSIKVHTKHGDSRSRLYKIYRGMLDRCYNPHTASYNSYGGQGVKVCKQWHNPKNPDKAYKKFRKWAYANGYYDQPKDTPYGDLLSIERKDPTGDYCPENCTWIPMRLQGNNRRNTKYIWDGEEILQYRQFANKYNIRIEHIPIWIKKYGIDVTIHRAKTGELLKKASDGYWRDTKTGFIRLLRHYDQSRCNR